MAVGAGGGTVVRMDAVRVSAEAVDVAAEALGDIAQRGDRYSQTRALEALEALESGIAEVHGEIEVMVEAEHERFAVSVLTAFLTGIEDGEGFGLLAGLLSDEVRAAPDPTWVVAVLAAMARVACDTTVRAVESAGGVIGAEVLLEALRAVAGELEGFWDLPGPGREE